MDAATAMYFALSVTYPVAAGLGGGGILCIVRDHRDGGNQAEEFDFLARDASSGGAYAVPGNVRGFALMQSLYGALPWQRDVAPGEGHAATGFAISHGARRPHEGVSGEGRDPPRRQPRCRIPRRVRRRQAGGHGRRQSRSRADTRRQIRTGGPAFYRGPVGARASPRLFFGAGRRHRCAGVRALHPDAQRRQPQGRCSSATQTVFLPSSHSIGAGAFAGALFETLGRARQTSIGEADLQASVVVAVKQALARFGVTNLPHDPRRHRLCRLRDHNGQSVACAVTMNGPFGSGHNVEGTGVTLARAPSSGEAGLAAAFLTPVIATDGSGNVFARRRRRRRSERHGGGRLRAGANLAQARSHRPAAATCARPASRLSTPSTPSSARAAPASPSPTPEQAVWARPAIRRPDVSRLLSYPPPLARGSPSVARGRKRAAAK